MKKIILTTSAFFALNILFSQIFERVEQAAGLDQIRNLNGVAAADYDRDGDLDLFFTGIINFHPSNPDSWNRLMRNNGDGTFTDVTADAGFNIQFINEGIPAERGEKMGVAWGDYDNDGYPDVFFANSREDQLYHNNGDGTFSDVTATAGVKGCNICYSASGTWWDHNRDGYLDLSVSVVNGANFLYENNGDGTFTDVTSQFNIAGNLSITWSSVALDVGRDGYLDLLQVNDTQINEFFENRSGIHYNESSRAYRLADEGAGMGVTIGDYNNDGFFDIYVTNIFNHHPNPLFKNLGNRRFEDVAATTGVEDTGWGWGARFLDYDHDGDEDLAAVNGPIDKLNQADQPDIDNFLFKNRFMESGQANFDNVSDGSGIDEKAKGKGFEAFDYDGDGDLDLVVANMEDIPFLFENKTIDGNQPADKNWVQFELEGTTSNRNAFGTEVKITVDGKSYYRWHHGGAIFGQSILPVHFGIGSASQIDEVEITWLSGLKETYSNIKANNLYKITEADGISSTGEVTQKPIFSITEFAPNPFSETTRLNFQSEEKGSMNFRVFTPFGKLVFEKKYENIAGGSQTISWNGHALNGSKLSKGVYIYSVQFKNQISSGRLIKL